MPFSDFANRAGFVKGAANVSSENHVDKALSFRIVFAAAMVTISMRQPGMVQAKLTRATFPQEVDRQVHRQLAVDLAVRKSLYFQCLRQELASTANSARLGAFVTKKQTFLSHAIGPEGNRRDSHSTRE